MHPTLQDGDTVLVDLSRRSPVPPGIFVLHDGIGLVAKRLEHIPNSDPPAMRVISDNPIYGPYERTADEIHIVGRIRWFAGDLSMAHVIIRGGNGRRHEVDFKDADIIVELHASEDHVELVIEASDSDAPRERNASPLVNIPRHPLSKAMADLARKDRRS